MIYFRKIIAVVLGKYFAVAVELIRALFAYAEGQQPLLYPCAIGHKTRHKRLAFQQISE